MGRSRKPVQPSDDAAIARVLRTDSEILRYAEWWVRRRVYGLNDAETRYLRDRYIESYRNLLSTLPDAYDSEGKPVLAQRAQLLAQIERELATLMGATAVEVETALFDGFKQGYYGRAWLLDQVTVPEWTANYNVLLPTEAIRAALLQEYIGTNEWFSGEREVLTAAVKRSVTNSLITGEGMSKAAARLRRELGIQPGQTGAFKGSMYRTMLITRTEIMRASNLGALTIYEQNQDVLSGWEWVATRDERTCPQCGALDGRTFKFGDPMLQPPSGSHPGCRCTVVPVLRDTELMDRISGGPRETYCDWAAARGIVDDAGLCRQRSAIVPSNQPEGATPETMERAQAENRASIFAAKGITPEILHQGLGKGDMADYMYKFFAYDDQANPVFNREMINAARLDLLLNVYQLGRGTVWQDTGNNIRMQAAALLSAESWAGGKLFKAQDRMRLTQLASPDDQVMFGAIDDIRDRRLKGTLAIAKERSENRGKVYDKFVSAAEADGAERLRELRLGVRR